MKRPIVETSYIVVELGSGDTDARVIEVFPPGTDTLAVRRRWALQEGFDSADNRKRDRSKQILVVRVEWVSAVPVCSLCEWAAPDCTCGHDGGWSEVSSPVASPGCHCSCDSCGNCSHHFATAVKP